MEAKLKEYRTLRRRKELLDAAKEKLEKSKEKIVDFIVPKIFKDMHKEKKEDEMLLLEHEDTLHLNQAAEIRELNEPEEIGEVETFEEEEESPESWQYFIIKWSIIFILWLMFFAIFLKLQFGAVFFVLSLLIGICLNTRTRPRRKGEVSAYSVFNKNCASLKGTLKAEQFENEIRYGPGSVRIY